MRCATPRGRTCLAATRLWRAMLKTPPIFQGSANAGVGGVAPGADRAPRGVRGRALKNEGKHPAHTRDTAVVGFLPQRQRCTRVDNELRTHLPIIITPRVPT